MSMRVSKTFAVISSLAVTSIFAVPCALADEPSYYLNGAVTRIADDQFDLDAFTARIGWNATDHFGVEGEVSLPTGTDEQGVVGFELDETYAIFATARTDLSDTIGVFVRAGLIDTGVEVTSPLGTDVDTRRSGAVGVGATVSFTTQFGLRLGYTYSKSDAFDAGIVWRF